MKIKRIGTLLSLALLASAALARHSEFRHLSMKDGTRLEFRLVAPSQPRDEYPFLLALPPGPQTADTVDWGMDYLYQDQAIRRGWVVLSPAAPQGQLFFGQSAKYLPELVRELAKKYPPEGGKFHLAGVSNGGLSAFHIAVLHPELFHSIAVLPGWPSPGALDQLERLKGIPLRMWVGEHETTLRVDLMKKAEERLRAHGSEVELIVLSGEGHNLLKSLGGGDAVFDFLEKHRPGGGKRAQAPGSRLQTPE